MPEPTYPGVVKEENSDDHAIPGKAVTLITSFAKTLRRPSATRLTIKSQKVMRLTRYIEEALYDGTKWVVFEPTDERLWSQIRRNVGAFMDALFREGALSGATAEEAYFVKCDQETNTQADRDAGAVNVLIGFAPLKRAEFVVMKVQHFIGQVRG